MSSSNKIVLVTGCSEGGIGFYLCNEFCKSGCKVYATSRRLESMQAFSANPQVTCLRLDVTSEESITETVKVVLEREGRIDILVNNAGVGAIGPLIEQSAGAVVDAFNTNTFSVLNMTRAVFPSMADRKSGLVVNIGSIVGEIPTPWNGLYSATKSALQTISEVLSMEFKPFNIRVMHVSPGGVRSNISENQAAKLSPSGGSTASNLSPLSPTSRYSQFAPNIIARIFVSQAGGSMPTAEFARKVVGQALKNDPPRYLSVGNHARLFQFLKWLPRTWVLWLMWRRFTQ